MEKCLLLIGYHGCSADKTIILNHLTIIFGTFSIVAPDLYEEIPKLTCFPERNHKYEMKVQAKLDCGNDKKCAAVVESETDAPGIHRTVYWHNQTSVAHKWWKLAFSRLVLSRALRPHYVPALF